MTFDDLFHLLDSSMQSRIHEGERFPLYAIVHNKLFAPSNVACHPVIELSEASQCHQL